MINTEFPHEEAGRRLKEILSRGLCHGQGSGGGQVCVEQAIAIACGCAIDEPDTSITDAPDCVSPAVRRYAIVLNDANWSSPQKRAAGLTEFALAQLGTQLLDEQEFAKRVAIRTVSRILPVTLRRVAALIPTHAEALEAAAKLCEGSTDVSAESAASAAESAAWGAASAAWGAAWGAAESAARGAAESAAWGAASAASAAESAAESAASAASAAESAASAASAAESAAWGAAESAAESAARDEVLTFAAKMVTEVLDEMRKESLPQ
jgi:hypothetical protein